MKNIKFLKDNIVLIMILCLSFFLNFYLAWNSGYSNEYYSAAVKSMLLNFHNFFYASFDPGGFVTVDKPPLALWVQCLSAYILGFNGVSILFPEAIASVISVGMLYKIVNRNFGKTAGLIASFILATTPIFVAVSRTNNMDSILVLLIMIAAWYITLASESGSLKILIIAVVIIGLGFNVKMLEAYMVLPAFYLTYLISISINIKQKIRHLTIATVVLLIVSLSWAIVVDLISAENRPYIGSSSTNSVLELALGYNGIQRVLPSGRSMGGNNYEDTEIEKVNTESNDTSYKVEKVTSNSSAKDSNNMIPPQGFNGQQGDEQSGNEMGVNEGGQQSIFRLFNKQMAGQMSWLLMIVFVGILAGFRYLKDIQNKFEKRFKLQSVVLWSSWIAPMLVYFSISGFFHRYYLSILAPAVAAMVGIGLDTMWDLYIKESWEKFLLPVALVLNSVVEIIILSRYEGYRNWLIPINCSNIIIAIVLIFINKKELYKATRYLFITGIISLLVAPISWTFTPLIYGNSSMTPYAGPELENSIGMNMQNRNSGRNNNFKMGDREKASQKLINFLLKKQNGERFIVAVSNATAAESIILSTGKGVMAMGGFSGSDKILTVEKLEKMVSKGEIRYVLINDFDNININLENQSNNQNMNNDSIMQNNGENFSGDRIGAQSEITYWIRQHGVEVSKELWSDTSLIEDSTNSFMKNSQNLYDLKPDINN